MFSFRKNRSEKKSSTSSKARRSTLRLEALEDRKLMAISVMTIGNLGDLVIGCDDANDNITVYQSGSNTMVRSINPAGVSTVRNLGPSITKLSIYATGGDDTVNNNTHLPATIYGGNGNDTLKGGSSADLILGEAGNDNIQGNAGRDLIGGGIGNDTVLGGSGDDDIYGGLGDDLLYGDDKAGAAFISGIMAGNDKVFGEDGLDRVYGGSGDDLLYGGLGDDYLYGQNGNDRLFGQDGYDHLMGQNVDDFLDAGSNSEYSNGTAGNDFNAYVTAVNGAAFNDISQGNSDNCFILGSMGVAAIRGIDMASRITYVGNGNYNVSLFQRTTSGSYTPTTVSVQFDGTLRSTDPAAHFRAQEGESWTIIMNRALAQLLNVNLDTTTGDYAGTVLAAITGTGPVTQKWSNASVNPYLNDGVLDYLYAVGNARPTIVSTFGAPARDSSLFAAAHVYMVHSVIISGFTWSPITFSMVPQYQVLLYNPHGVDNQNFGKITGAISSGDNTDGLILISGAQFKASFGEITRA